MCDGNRDSVKEDEKFPEMDGDAGDPGLWVYLMLLSCTLKHGHNGGTFLGVQGTSGPCTIIQGPGVPPWLGNWSQALQLRPAQLESAFNKGSEWSILCHRCVTTLRKRISFNRRERQSGLY